MYTVSSGSKKSIYFLDFFSGGGDNARYALESLLYLCLGYNGAHYPLFCKLWVAMQ